MSEQGKLGTNTITKLEVKPVNIQSDDRFQQEIDDAIDFSTRIQKEVKLINLGTIQIDLTNEPTVYTKN